jgi:hypothetical protein
MSFYVILCHFMSSYVIFCHLKSSNVILCHLMSSHVILYHLMSSYRILQVFQTFWLLTDLFTYLLTYLHLWLLEGPSPLKIINSLFKQGDKIVFTECHIYFLSKCKAKCLYRIRENFGSPGRVRNILAKSRWYIQNCGNANLNLCASIFSVYLVFKWSIISPFIHLKDIWQCLR